MWRRVARRSFSGKQVVFNLLPAAERLQTGRQLFFLCRQGLRNAALEQHPVDSSIDVKYTTPKIRIFRGNVTGTSPARCFPGQVSSVTPHNQSAKRFQPVHGLPLHGSGWSNQPTTIQNMGRLPTTPPQTSTSCCYHKVHYSLRGKPCTQQGAKGRWRASMSSPVAAAQPPRELNEQKT